MYKRGTVVLIPFPFTDLSGTKVRPAIIISHGTIGDDMVVVFITSRSKRKAPYLVPLLPSASNGIKVASHAVCSKIATLEHKIALGELGTLSKADMQAVTVALRAVLDL